MGNPHLLYRLLTGIAFLVCSFSASAQFNHFGDSLRSALHTKPSFVIGLDGRKSFYHNRQVSISGIRIGLEYKKKIKFYIGYYELDGVVKDKILVNKLTPNQMEMITTADFKYVQAGCDYIFHDKGRWQFTLPVLFGYGVGTRERFTADSSYYMLRRTEFAPMELGVSGMYRIFYWLGFGASIGYRFSFPSYLTSSAFDGPVYSAGVRLFPFKIVKAIFKGKDSVRIR